jgi:type IV secretory pathway TrbF-like protein
MPTSPPDIHLRLPDLNDFAAARRQYVEVYGSTQVMNTYLKVAVLFLSVVAVTLVFLNVKTNSAMRHVQPLIVRIDEVGRAQAVSYGSFEYHPQEAEIKYFLVQFVQQYYGRMRATVQENYPRSLYFLDGRLSEAILETNKKTSAVESFLVGQSDEIDIEVRSIAIEDLRKAPFKAAVEFDKIYLSASQHTELRRERFVANFVFVVKQPVPNALVPINPLGLTITYFREDQAFDHRP